MLTKIAMAMMPPHGISSPLNPWIACAIEGFVMSSMLSAASRSRYGAHDIEPLG